MEENEKNHDKKILILIPKIEEYMQYILELLIKLPRTEKFSVGTEYKSSMYQLIESVMYVSKIEKTKRGFYLNKIDANLNCQRVYLRVMLKNRWIDERKFKIAMEKIGEIGRIVGGLIKYYAKDNQK